MFIIYNNVLFDSLNEKNHFTIITRQEAKASGDFLKTSRSFYKEIPQNDSLIQDIYDLQFFLEWDSHFKGVDKIWKIATDGGCFNGNQIKLMFGRGNLPGWKLEENNICYTYVDIDECSNFSVAYIYTVKDGKVLEEPLTVTKEVSSDEFRKTIEQHDLNNI